MAKNCDAVTGVDGIKGAGAVVHFSNFSRLSEGAGFTIYWGGVWCGYVGCLVCRSVLIDVSLSSAIALIGDL